MTANFPAARRARRGYFLGTAFVTKKEADITYYILPRAFCAHSRPKRMYKAVAAFNEKTYFYA